MSRTLARNTSGKSEQDEEFKRVLIVMSSVINRRNGKKIQIILNHNWIWRIWRKFHSLDLPFPTNSVINGVLHFHNTSCSDVQRVHKSRCCQDDYFFLSCFNCRNGLSIHSFWFRQLTRDRVLGMVDELLTVMSKENSRLSSSFRPINILSCVRSIPTNFELIEFQI